MLFNQVVELKLNESLPPEQYREPAVDKNQKMKLQLEVTKYYLKISNTFFIHSMIDLFQESDF